MKRAFRDHFNRELALLKQRASEFAQDYPGLADRLGGLLEENLDPTVAGLLEGSAFLAARVQLKMQEEFRTLTREYLDQVFPGALAQTPSVMMVQARLPDDLAVLENGMRFKPRDYLDARFLDADKRVACRFSLAAPLELWPIELSQAVYHGSPGPVGALGQEIAEGTKAGLVLTLNRLNEAAPNAKAVHFSGLIMDELTIHLNGLLGDAVAIYEQILCGVVRLSLRWLNAQGDPVFARMDKGCIEQIGFRPTERLFPDGGRIFSGFAMLRELFVFPQKFLGFRLTGLAKHLAAVRTDQLQLVLEFSSANPRLSQRLEVKNFVLHAAPAVNLFEEISSQVRIDNKHHEYVVTPNSSPMTHYELHDVKEVWAFFSGRQDKVRVYPLYARPPGVKNPHQLLYFASRRRPRRMTLQEKRHGASRYRYRGTETFITIHEPPGEDKVRRLQVRAMCSNRHLPEYLPIAQGVDGFHFCEDQRIALNCIAGPTPPRDSLVDLETGNNHRGGEGDMYWRLVSYLSLAKSGIDGPDPEETAAALRELLGLFADLSHSPTALQVAGLQRVETRPVTRTMAHPDGFHPARGLEVTLTFDEDEFEGSGVILFGAVIDRFLAEHAAINSFSQTIIRSVQRGQIKVFPPRSGKGPIL